MDTLTDADLIGAVLDGDRDAFGVLYDRHADRIFTTCVHLLGDRDEAADVTAEVFLVAVERLSQLRDPEKLRAWLYAIARHLVQRRGRQQRRVTYLPAVSESVAAELVAGGPDVEEQVLGAGTDRSELADLLQVAGAGLDERDRTVLELHLAHGLEGPEVAQVLGVSVGNGYQLVHRMKQRLERSTGALLVARAGRDSCGDLAAVTADWDGGWSVLWRKRVARHVDRCERCTAVRARVPRAVLAGTALAVAAQSTVLAAPASARSRVLGEAPSRLGRPGPDRWRRDGFPGRRRPIWPAVLAGFAVVAVVVLLAAGDLGRGTVEDIATDGGARGRPIPAQAEPGTSPGPGEDGAPKGARDMTSDPDAVTGDSPPGDGDDVAALEPATPADSLSAPQAGGAGSSGGAPPMPPTTTAATTTTTPADTTPPSVVLQVAAGCAPLGTSAKFTVETADDTLTTAVTLTWWDGTGDAGSVTMSGGPSTWDAAVGVSPVWETTLWAKATASDAAGNVATSKTGAVTVAKIC
jgi:RNA polymerase sigma factor (sigma-70 family)